MLHRIDWVAATILTVAIAGVSFMTLGLLLDAHTSTCDWSCWDGNRTCQPGDGPFCPENNLMDCELYFLRGLSNDCPSTEISQCSPCTLYLASYGNDITLSLPFYGFFIDGITLNNVSYVQLGDQTMKATFGSQGHTFSPLDRTVTLTNDGYHFRPTLLFHYYGPIYNGLSLLFIESLTVQFNPTGLGLTGVVIIVLSWLISVTLVFFIRLGLRRSVRFKQPLDETPLMIN